MTVAVVILGVLVVGLVASTWLAWRDWTHPQRMERDARRRGAM